MHFIQLGDLHIRVHLGAPDNLALLIPIGTSFITRFVTGIFFMERGIVPNTSRPFANISEYMRLSNPLALL